MFEVGSKIRLKHFPEKEYIVVAHLPNGMPIIRNDIIAFNISDEAFSSYEKVPEKKTGWINIYQGYVGNIYPTKELAGRAGRREIARIACVEISYYEGQGL